MPKQKFDDQELIAALTLHKGNVTYAAEELGVTRAAVIKRKKTIPDGVLAETVTEFRTQRADIFARLQQVLLQHITPAKLKGASLAQIGTLLGIMYDKERLEKNLSTENIAHNHYEQLDQVDRKMLQELVKKRTKKKLDAIFYSEDL